MTADLKTIEKLLQLAKKYKLTEFELEDGKFKVHFKSLRGTAPVAEQSVQKSIPIENPVIAPAQTQRSAISVVNPTVPPADFGQDSAPAKLRNEVDAERYHKVMSPFVGTFYRAPAPDSDPYVSETQAVRKGDILCIVEAMKLMNEIECEVSGKVISCLVENGQPVEYGEPLFLIDEAASL